MKNKFDIEFISLCNDVSKIRHEALKNIIMKFSELCNERGLEIVRQNESLDQFNDQLHILFFQKDVKINVTYTSYEGKYCYAVYVHKHIICDYDSRHTKERKKLYLIRYFFDMRSAILYAKHLQGEKMCWSISENPFKKFIFYSKRIIYMHVNVFLSIFKKRVLFYT